MARLRIILFLGTCLATTAWSAQQYTVKVTEQKPQSRGNFVQGLEILDDYLYVSTGLYGESRLLRYHFATGSLESAQRLNSRYFGEGLTVLGDKVYQLTWRNKKMLVYRKSDFQLQKSLPLIGEGWGLTNNGTHLIYSDGSAKLRFMFPDTAQVLRTLTVTDEGQPVKLLNELEWIDGAIWANIWRTDQIVIIDPVSAKVTATINLTGLLPSGEHHRGTDVLNGIARDPADGSIWVTGKRWPWLYRIELVPVLNNSEIHKTQSQRARIAPLQKSKPFRDPL
jgi:glutamine cyclotransferase